MVFLLYLCIRLAALGKLKTSFLSARLHNLCIRLAALGKQKTSFLSTRLRNLCISKQECGVSARTDRGAAVEYIELLLL